MPYKKIPVFRIHGTQGFFLPLGENRHGLDVYKRQEEDGVLTMSMPGETVEELCGLLRPHAGEYPLTSYPLTVELIPTQIRDAQGNILREIG